MAVYITDDGKVFDTDKATLLCSSPFEIYLTNDGTVVFLSYHSAGHNADSYIKPIFMTKQNAAIYMRNHSVDPEKIVKILPDLEGV